MKTIFKNALFRIESTDIHEKSSLCMVVNEDLIEFIGSENHEQITALQTENVRTVDIQGHTILPSFIDGHMHMLAYASSLVKISLEHCTNLSEIRAAIKDAAVANPTAPRLFCSGWQHHATNGIALASMIDDIDPRPIFIDASDLHSTWCNTAALNEIGVQNMPDPVGGHIHRDEHGNPSGLIDEQAAFTITWPHFGKVVSENEKEACIRTAIDNYSAAGYTGIIEMAMDAAVWSTLKAMRSKGTLNVRIAAHWLITPSATDSANLAQVDTAIHEHQQYNLATSPNFRIAGIKLITDGVIDACTAAISQPYNNGAHPDTLWAPLAMQQVVQKADAAGLQCALHAIGDRAVTLAIDALSALNTSGRRHRIEHLEYTRPEDAKRLGAAGITASVQPVHCDPSVLDNWPNLIGAERCKRGFAYREFVQHGAPLAIGTDAPTAPYWPFPNMYIATTRRSAKWHEQNDREVEEPQPVNERFKLDLEDALSGATWSAAYSCFAESFTGALEVGKKADFVIVKGWKEDGTALLGTRVMETWFEGRKVYPFDES